MEKKYECPLFKDLYCPMANPKFNKNPCNGTLGDCRTSVYFKFLLENPSEEDNLFARLEKKVQN